MDNSEQIEICTNVVDTAITEETLDDLILNAIQADFLH